MNEIAGSVLAFAIIGILFVGFFLIIPATYDRIDVTDLGAQGNETLDTAYNFTTSLQGTFGILILVLGILSLMLVVLFVAGRR